MYQKDNNLMNILIKTLSVQESRGEGEKQREMVKRKAFLKKGKDADMECVFECDDTF